MELAHFRRHKRKALKKTSGKSANYSFHKSEENHPPGKHSSKRIPKIIGTAANIAGSAKTKKVWLKVVGYKVVVKKVGSRIIKKIIHVRVEHVQPSRCTEEFCLRKVKNDELKAEAKAKGTTI